MKLLQRILSRLSGLKFQQEYLCLEYESFQPILRVYLVQNFRILAEITNSHLFTGYCPLIISILASTLPENTDKASIQLIFTNRVFLHNDSFNQKDAIAGLHLRLFKEHAVGNTTLLHYEGINGRHKFVSSFSRYIIGLQNSLFNKKPGNVFLHNKLYKQVQIAYSIPRIISLVTINTGGLFNLFPTDLHGALNEKIYISSLRHEGKACMQVETAGKIVLSNVAGSIYKTVYKLGKNHMQNAKHTRHFPFDNQLSIHFQLPIPKGTLAYYELEVIDSFTCGIHRIFIYKIHAKEILSTTGGTLAHVHNVYATWRYNKGLSGNYLIR